MSDSENRYSDSFSSIRVMPIVKDNRRSSWSVADKIKTVEDNQSVESKGYSTKVNFGEGEATVVENDGFYDKDRHPTWPRVENSSKVYLVNTKHHKRQKPNQKNSQTLRLVIVTQKDNKIPQQLEALKKLYEDVQSDSDADKEVQLLMSKITEKDINKIEDDNSSIVSGSWSKMRAYKNISEHFSRTNIKEATSRYDIKSNTKLEKSYKIFRCTTERLTENETSTNTETSRNKPSKYVNSNRSKFSPVVLRKTIPVINRPDLKSAVTTENLSSPSLVGRNASSFDYPEKLDPSSTAPNGRHSPSKEFKNNLDRKLQNKHINDSIVLRQPKKSEMTYFGVNLSPKPGKKIFQAVIRKEINKPRQKSPEITKEDSGPIYENLKESKGKYSREFDSSILDELTKAADQILQAVNGYTDEDSHNKFSTDDEETKKNMRNEQLDTISETKSWKQQTQTTKSKPPYTKTKLKHTSSTSSVESLSRRRVASSSAERKPTLVKGTPERQINKRAEKSDSSVVKANTKARRLQRASSREALLQSHGSSSEDLAANIEVPVRKPRLIKKTKAMQLTVTNGLELKKSSGSTTRKKEDVSNKSEERILGSLPEIRHKTAVSAIRSTVDKSTRERTRHRGINSSTRPEREKSKTATLNKETVTHRISTAYVPVCRNRSRTMHARHQDTDCPCLCS
ncbi:hypothetical protein NQ314_019459 [Rhamnusium bicolor]|uniref:Uncharacterized protein n=1 Tax=Rhamnusium bicolor TaxID=1586634 RepID=A0AAV8WQP1_9CUCU|nr:hypothetical protein NQ314_019459 [Rhamnusium bicolor]